MEWIDLILYAGRGADIFTVFMRIILQIFVTCFIYNLFINKHFFFLRSDEYWEENLERNGSGNILPVKCEIVKVLYFIIVKIRLRLKLNLITFPVTKWNIRWELIFRRNLRHLTNSKLTRVSPAPSFSALLIAKLAARLGTGMAWQEAGDCLGFMK